MGACPPRSTGGHQAPGWTERAGGGDPRGDPVPAPVPGQQQPPAPPLRVWRGWRPAVGSPGVFPDRGGKGGCRGCQGYVGVGGAGGERSLVQRSPAVRCACLRHHLVLKGGISRNSGQDGRKNTVL